MYPKIQVLQTDYLYLNISTVTNSSKLILTKLPLCLFNYPSDYFPKEIKIKNEGYRKITKKENSYEPI